RADAGPERRHHRRLRSALRTGAGARPRPDGSRRPTHPGAEDAPPRRSHRRAAPERRRPRGLLRRSSKRVPAAGPRHLLAHLRARRHRRRGVAGSRPRSRSGERRPPGRLVLRSAARDRRVAIAARAALRRRARHGGAACRDTDLDRPRALAAGLAPAVGLAHGLDPASLALRETRAGVFEVRWRASALRLPGANVQPVLPARCRQVGPADAVDETDRITLRWTVECGPGGLEGDVIGLDDLAAAKINALLTVERLDGEKLQ